MSVRYSFVSTYPPTQCGLASFAASLRSAMVLLEPGPASVIRVVDTPQLPAPAGVVAELVAGDGRSLRAAAELINVSDVAIVQHEYGIYGGADGEEVLALLDAIRVPRVLVLHTVPTEPTWRQRWVLQAVLSRAEAVVLMTDAARDRLLALYDVDELKLTVIPHGAHEIGVARTGVVGTGRPTVLTWGLLGPGKGIEWGIGAMRELIDLHPTPRYLVAGQTHPKVLAYEGEVYRNRLVAQVAQLGLGDVVEFDGRYHSTASLGRLIGTADVVLLPYDSVDQITSGVLTEAVAALLPVVATRFPHAVELLGSGAGQLVAHRDPAAIAAALRAVLTQRGVAAGMVRAAARTAPDLSWAMVARRYRDLAAELLSPSLAR